MKKIMFSDKFGLTEAVLSGRKTQTRRVVSESLWDKWTEYDDFCGSVGVGGLSEIGVAVTREYSDCEKFFLDNSPFKVGEVVAVAQSYKDCGYAPDALDRSPKDLNVVRGTLGESKGWNNKMFVRSDACKHHIRITDVRVERLQDISDEDCMAEGVEKVAECENLYRVAVHHKSSKFSYLSGKTPREAYAALIDRISGKGTWESNPYVFVYEFELIK